MTDDRKQKSDMVPQFPNFHSVLCRLTSVFLFIKHHLNMFFT